MMRESDFQIGTPEQEVSLRLIEYASRLYGLKSYIYSIVDSKILVEFVRKGGAHVCVDAEGSIHFVGSGDEATDWSGLTIQQLGYELRRL